MLCSKSIFQGAQLSFQSRKKVERKKERKKERQKERKKERKT